MSTTQRVIAKAISSVVRPAVSSDGYVQTPDLAKARKIARRLRAGQVHINYADWSAREPFGGFKQSGNGREHGEFGLGDFLELKATAGYSVAE
jgi:aldehyde dehydrogenase (NAD+)